jgi:hypothetical protein
MRLLGLSFLAGALALTTAASVAARRPHTQGRPDGFVF